jgi:hypothetical protein
VGGFVCVLLVVGLIGVLVWQFIETKNALATTTIDTAHAPAETAQIVTSAFTGARAVLWANSSGPGTFNLRRRGVRGGITMSIDIEPLANGGSRVDMWASQTTIYLGVLVNFAGVVNRRKKAIMRSLG